MVDLDGIIIQISNAEQGNVHDLTILTDHNYSNFYENMPGPGMVDDDLNFTETLLIELALTSFELIILIP